jgi:hypothetical protein
MSEIFISYASKDKSRAKIFAEALEHQGFSVWWDVIIPPGKTFDDVIKEELDSAKCIIVLWSRKSVLSNWVKEESSEGVNRNILIPVLIDDVKIPLGFRRIQAAQLIDWSGTLPNPEFDLLLKSVTKLVEQKQPPEVTKPEEQKQPPEVPKRKIIPLIVFRILQVFKYVLYGEKVSKWLRLYTIMWLLWAALWTLLCLDGFFVDDEHSFFVDLVSVTIVFLFSVIIPFLPIYLTFRRYLKIFNNFS